MIINFGSINVDHVYRVERLPVSGETVMAASHQQFLGGKGINHSIAISKAGGELIHVGAVGADGDWAISEIRNFGVDTTHIDLVEEPTGHAIICVDDDGENQIVVLSGANRALKQENFNKVLASSGGDATWVLLQNETNLATEVVNTAKSAGVKIAYAAAPFVADVTVALIDKIDLLAVNQGEANELAAELGVEPHEIPVPKLLITKGSKGVEFHFDGEVCRLPAFEVPVLDTTGAGDTFFGSFLARYEESGDPALALAYATAASAIQVTRAGAAIAIPEKLEVMKFLEENQTA